MKYRIALPLLLAFALLGCAPKNQSKRYPMDGRIVALDPATKSATIQAGPIGDWMDSMTMEYPVKPDSEFAKLHVGDHIHAFVVVQDPSYYVTDVTVQQK
jgi:Cu/Ag efflux protein CusF